VSEQIIISVRFFSQLNTTSLRRFVSAQDVANMALFLASDLARSISGQAMSVDGHTESLGNVLV
jgi:enoyl-[acyl-carrier-protein] reductase (NADH)